MTLKPNLNLCLVTKHVTPPMGMIYMKKKITTILYSKSKEFGKKFHTKKGTNKIIVIPSFSKIVLLCHTTTKN